MANFGRFKSLFFRFILEAMPYVTVGQTPPLPLEGVKIAKYRDVFHRRSLNNLQITLFDKFEVSIQFRSDFSLLDSIICG